jgi:putative transposase
MKTHYTAAELAEMKLPGLPTSKRRIYDRACRDGWAARQVPAKGGKGGMRTEYAVASLPKEVRESILHHKIKTVSPSGVVTAISAPEPGAVTTVAAPTYPIAPLDPEHCTARQREEKLARHTVLRKLDELMHASGCSKEVAMATMLTMARTGTLGEALCSTLRMARDPRGRKGDEYPSVRSLKRWIAKDKAGDLMPRVAQPDMRILPWHALAIALRRRPQGSSFTWLHSELKKQWNAEWGTIPGYHAVCRFFRDKFSQIDQLKGRYTGSALRSHKFYQHRTSEGLVPAMEVHADGWNTHFTAPHPVTGEFVTYEVWHFHDVATRYVTPPGIGLTENFEVIAKGLENYIRVLGVMLIVQTDSTKIVRGSARFTKDPVRSIEERVGCTVVHPKEVGNSQANGICENFNVSYLDKRSRELATYQAKDMDTLTFKRVKRLTAAMVKAATSGDMVERDRLKREAERMGKGMVFDSHTEAVEWINRIHAEYNNRPHRSLPKIRCPQTGRMRHQTPAEALEEHRAHGWEPVLMGDTPEAHETFLIDTFRPRVIVPVTRETVSPYGGMRFRNAEALGHWNGKDVVVVYDIHEWRSVRVEQLNGALICMAEFVAATGYRAVTAYEDAEEKRARAQIRRREKQIAQIEARNPTVAIEEQTVKTIVDFIDVNPQPARERELTIHDFLPEKGEEKESSYSDTVMWLYGEQQEETKEGAAAR